MPKVSIIIPVYNTSAYLRRCLDSVLLQTEHDFEAICVNDGSTDNSLDILIEYSKKDSRIKVISQKNGGLSAARNTGLANCEGQYIMLLDSDDYIVENACQILYEKASAFDLDIVQASLIQFDDDGKEMVLQTQIPTDDTVFSGVQWLANHYYETAAQFYFCKRDFIETNNIRFKQGIYHEDCEIIPRLLSKANRVQGINFGFYRYYVRSGSITQSKNIKRVFDLMGIGDSIVDFASDFEDIILKNVLFDYAAVVYAAAVQSAVKQGIALTEVFAQKGLRKSFCKKLYKFGKLKHKLMSIFIFFHLDNSFGFIYKIFMEK